MIGEMIFLHQLQYIYIEKLSIYVCNAFFMKYFFVFFYKHCWIVFILLVRHTYIKLCSMDEIHNFSKILEPTPWKRGGWVQACNYKVLKGVWLNRSLNFSSHVFSISKLWSSYCDLGLDIYFNKFTIDMMFEIDFSLILN